MAQAKVHVIAVEVPASITLARRQVTLAVIQVVLLAEVQGKGHVGHVVELDEDRTK